VTCAILFSGRGKTNVTEAVTYIVSQLLGGFFAGLTYYGIYNGAFELKPTTTWGAAGMAEVIFTFVLCFVVLNVATTKAPSKDMFGLAIGSCVTVGGFAVGGVSGASLNPAVSFGLDSASAIAGHAVWKNCLAYAAFEIVGGAIAAGAFYVTRPAEFTKDYEECP